VLFSHGARFGGHSLYVKDRKLKYVYNFVGSNEQTVESTVTIPTGAALLSAAFVKAGDGGEPFIDLEKEAVAMMARE
jgi:hypothetical protein